MRSPGIGFHPSRFSIILLEVLASLLVPLIAVILFYFLFLFGAKVLISFCFMILFVNKSVFVLAVSDYPLSAVVCLERISIALERKWNIL